MIKSWRPSTAPDGQHGHKQLDSLGSTTNRHRRTFLRNEKWPSQDQNPLSGAQRTTRCVWINLKFIYIYISVYICVWHLNVPYWATSSRFIAWMPVWPVRRARLGAVRDQVSFSLASLRLVGLWCSVCGPTAPGWHYVVSLLIFTAAKLTN